MPEVLNKFLKMPYWSQSTVGIVLKNNKPCTYCLTLVYNKLKGPNWPVNPSNTKEDIENLPDWVKHELLEKHQIDIFCLIGNI